MMSGEEHTARRVGKSLIRALVVVVATALFITTVYWGSMAIQRVVEVLF